MHAFLEEALENNLSAFFTPLEPPAGLAKSHFCIKMPSSFGQTHSWESVWWLTCNWLICIMWVPFLSLLTKASLSTTSTAPWMEMSCIPGVLYAAAGHKVSTWNIGLVQLRNRFQLYLIFIHLNEKKPYVGFVVDSADLWTRSLLIRREWPLPPGAALQTPLNTWWGFTCPPEGSGGDGWLPDLL